MRGRDFFIVAAIALGIAAGFLAGLTALASGWSAPSPQPRPSAVEIVRAVWPLLLGTVACVAAAAHPRPWTTWPAAALLVAGGVLAVLQGGFQLTALGVLIAALGLIGAVLDTAHARRRRSGGA